MIATFAGQGPFEQILSEMPQGWPGRETACDAAATGQVYSRGSLLFTRAGAACALQGGVRLNMMENAPHSGRDACANNKVLGLGLLQH